nr:hypothetical protein [Tanacetum cinerariifolium]
ELNMRQRRWLELLKDYDTNIQYHPGKANVVADALSKKSGMIAGIKVKGGNYSRFGAIKEAQKEDSEIWTIIENLNKQVEFCLDDDNVLWQDTRLEAQKEDSEIWTIVENLSKQVAFRLDNDHVLWQDTRLVVPNDATLREALLTEAHSLPHTQRRHDAIWVVVDRLTKSAHFLPICKDYSRASGLLQPLDIPVWKWDDISMDFATGLPRTQRRHDAIWVVVDRLTKSAHFLPIRKDHSVSKLAETFQ